jgi:hypothetical protein
MVARDGGRAALALLAALVALGGCGESGEAGAGEETEVVDIRGVGLVRAGSTAQFANCRDWRRGTVEERYATIEEIRGRLTPQTSATDESDLPDQDAYRVFQQSCAAEFADKARLYKIYASAQAFAPLTVDAGE